MSEVATEKNNIVITKLLHKINDLEKRKEVLIWESNNKDLSPIEKKILTSEIWAVSFMIKELKEIYWSIE